MDCQNYQLCVYTQDSSKCKSLGKRQMKFPYTYNTGKRMKLCPNQNGTNPEETRDWHVKNRHGRYKTVQL